MTLSETTPAIGMPGPPEAVEYLLRDRTWSAYALGYIDPAAGVPTGVWTEAENGETQALVLLAQLPQLVSVFCGGDPEGVARILGRLPASPASGVFAVQAEVLSALERHFHVSTAYAMRRLRVDAASLRPRRDVAVSRLGIDDLDAVARLYGMWTDNHQLPAQLTGGVYFGVYQGGDLVSVAGTHAVSPTFGVGAIGNVLTHISHRNRGLASTTTTAVAEELMRLGCHEVVLNVRQGNDVALATYRNLGFVQHCTFIEGVFHSRLGRR